MKHSFPSSSFTANPSSSLHRRLNSYALAATAAGVGMLALARAAEAKIIYTPANIQIPVNGGLIELDLNHDGINDFQFQNTYKTYTWRSKYHYHTSNLLVGPAQTLNRVLGHRGRRLTVWAAALPKGAHIGLNKAFQPGRYLIPMVEGRDNRSTRGTYGSWIDKQPAYLGLEFMIKGKIHFGWARLNVTVNSGSCKGICATLTGYAYETIPVKGIVAGRTKDGTETEKDAGELNSNPTSESTDSANPTLGRLAQGAQGLAVWRRRE
jgi:hypothetical protein